MSQLSDLLAFVAQIASMTTDEEMEGEMSGDDAVSALSGLIEQARDLIDN